MNLKILEDSGGRDGGQENVGGGNDERTRTKDALSCCPACRLGSYGRTTKPTVGNFSSYALSTCCFNHAELSRDCRK